MAGALQSPVALDQQVRNVRRENRGLLIESTTDRWRAEHVVVTAPPSAASRIDFNAQLPASVTKAWIALPYTFITLIYVETDPFWESDGLSSYMWTDGPFERWFPRLDAVSGETVGFKIWLNGAGALRADAMSEAHLQSALATELKRLRPASNGNLRLSRVMSWQQRGDYQGAYPEWPIGKAAALAAAFRQPTGRVRLAGDYTSETLTGLEGAAASGARAAAEILVL